MLAFGGILQVAEIIRTDSGNDLIRQPRPNPSQQMNILARIATSTAL